MNSSMFFLLLSHVDGQNPAVGMIVNYPILYRAASKRAHENERSNSGKFVLTKIVLSCLRAYKKACVY